ncbi:hypothetical protein PO909_007792 [Leuciscus waleckii]
MAGFENSSIPDLNPYLSITSLDHIQLNVFTSVLCISVLFGPPTHAYILWLIVKGRRIASEFLNFNISVCEICICVSYLTSLLVIRFPELGAFSIFLTGLYVTGRPLFLCLMCVERYLAVVHPVTFLKFKPLRYRVICCAAVWLMALGSCLFSMFTIVKYVQVYMCGRLLQFLLFLSVNLFCCLTVLWALKKPGPGKIGKERKERNQMKRRAFYLILIITATMVIMFVPAIISGFLFLLLSQDVLIYVYLSFFCFNLAGFVQPVMYLHQAGKLPFLCWS